MKRRVLDNVITPALAQQIQAFPGLSGNLPAPDIPDGLTNERLNTLVAVLIHEPVSISALAQVKLVSLPAMSRMVAALEAGGFVRRQECRRGEQRVLICATPKGTRAYQRATRPSLSPRTTQLQRPMWGIFAGALIGALLSLALVITVVIL